MNKRSFTWILLLTLLLNQCAKQTTPTGGPKDETPPTLIGSNPPNRQINFNRDEIELTFDEPVQANNPREQILITPTIRKKFETTIRKNKVVLKLNAALSENTTYTIAFRESIQDLSERNPVVNLKLAFSTGSHIDSLSIQGSVYNLLEGKPLKNFTVAAAPYTDTLSIFLHEAQWITLSDEDGLYSLENLKAGSYVVYAFEDKNKNLKVDSQSERYGFFAEPVQLQSSIDSLEIPVIKLDTRPLKLISAKPLSTYFNIRLSKGIDTYELNSLDTTLHLYTKADDASTIRVFNTMNLTDSIPVRFQAKDSIEHAIDTMFYLKFEQRSAAKEKLSIKVDEVTYLENASVLKGTIHFNKPILKFTTDSVYIQVDSLNSIHFTSEDFKWSRERTTLTFEKKIPKGTTFITAHTKSTTRQQPARTEPIDDQQESRPFNQLILPIGTFNSAEQDTSAYAQSSITTLKPETTGTIFVEAGFNESIIIQVLNKSYKVIAQSTQPKSRFDNLPPGEYQIRVVVDKNANQRWDAGNYFAQQEPEPIYFYRNEKGISIVSIKANWELGPLLITPGKHVDNSSEN
jgi:uncharacterized protein (DUF2141 family)